MKTHVLLRHNISSVLKIGVATTLLASLMLMGVDLFSHLDSYMNYHVGFMAAFRLTVMYFPEAFLLAMGPSFLFAVTYHLSMLHANNEIMAVLNSGKSFSSVLVPIVICAVLLSGFYFGFNELAAIPSSNEKEKQTELLTTASTSANNRNVALSDMESGYLVYAATYSDSDQTLFDMTLVEMDGKGRLLRRTDSYKAVYDQSAGVWVLSDVHVYMPDSEGAVVSVEHLDRQVNKVIRFEPQLFRNAGNDVSRMSLGLARAYLQRMKAINPDQYATLGTSYYKRIFSCLSPLIMMIIACSMNYRFRKNVLFLSLVCSIAVAVVYFVVQMMTMMMADQGVIAPYYGTLIPFAVILVLSAIAGTLLRRG
ncbi:MAG: LptF/LptG family permease [Spirochaetales bacterium]|nr:LptF/LptG family permease [Spirochaetales bacterium]